MGLSKSETKAKYDKVAGEDGVVALKDLHLLVREFGLPGGARDLVQMQSALRELLLNGDIVEDGIPFELWYQWYKLEVQPGTYDNQNELLVRRVIGKVKHPTRNLKDNSFVYGQRNRADKEGAGAVVLNWVAGERSESKEAGVSLLKVNKEAVKNKHVTAKAVNQFLRENKDAKHLQRPKVLGSKKSRGLRHVPVSGDEELPGKPGQRQPHEDIHKIIFPSKVAEEPTVEHYVDTSGQVRKGRLPKPRQTKCSELLRSHTKDVESQRQPVEPWKMSKFTRAAKHKVDMTAPSCCKK